MDKLYVVYAGGEVDFITDSEEIAKAHYKLYNQGYDEFTVVTDDPAVERAKNAVTEYIYSFVLLDNGYYNYCGEETRVTDPDDRQVVVEGKAIYDKPLIKIRVNGIEDKAEAWSLALDTLYKLQRKSGVLRENSKVAY